MFAHLEDGANAVEKQPNGRPAALKRPFRSVDIGHKLSLMAS